jgi:hypothetical protein
MTGELLQQKSLFTKIRFAFGPESFEYFVSDSSGVRSVTVPYLDIHPQSHYLFQESNDWYRNVGIVWTLLGLFYAYAKPGPDSFIFSVLGIACIGAYYASRINYHVFDTNRGKVFIMQDQQADDIIDRLREGQKKMVLLEVGGINFTHSFEEEKQKYLNLKKQGFLDEEECNVYLRELEESRSKFAR